MKIKNHPWNKGFNKTKSKGNRPIGGRGNVNKTVDIIIKKERKQSTGQE